MKKLGYEHHEASTYLVYELGPEDTVDSMSLGMLMNNRIPGFVPTIFTQIDNIKQIKCDVTARVPADQYLLGTVNKKRLLGVFRGIAQAFLSAEDYMIAVETIQLDLNCIFCNVVTGETALICVPVVREDREEPSDLKNFLKEILFSAQYDERENQDYVAKIMSYLNGTPTFSAREFMNLLDYMGKEPASRQELPRQAPAVEQWDGVLVAPVPPPTPEPEPKSVPAPPADGCDATEQAQHISLFYLLQHYNKENAAVYKEQKEQKKSEKREKAVGKKKEPKQRTAPPQNFAVPGQKEDPATVSALAPEPEVRPVQPIQPVQAAQPVQQVRQPEQTYQPQTPELLQQVRQDVIQQPFQHPAGVGALSFDEQSTVYFPAEDQDETLLMGQEIPVRRLIPYLLRKRNHEKIPITKPVFRIGRDTDYNDYVIPENRYIGHSHCHILRREGKYFLMDDNSKNRTKVNGEVVAAGAEVKIAHGCVIRIADEEFEFRLY